MWEVSKKKKRKSTEPYKIGQKYKLEDVTAMVQYQTGNRSSVKEGLGEI